MRASVKNKEDCTAGIAMHVMHMHTSYVRLQHTSYVHACIPLTHSIRCSAERRSRALAHRFRCLCYVAIPQSTSINVEPHTYHFGKNGMRHCSNRKNEWATKVVALAVCTSDVVQKVCKACAHTCVQTLLFKMEKMATDRGHICCMRMLEPHAAGVNLERGSILVCSVGSCCQQGIYVVHAVCGH